MIQKREILVKLGGRGEFSIRDEDWDEVCFGNVRQILISHGSAINSVQMVYDVKGRLVLGHRHGGEGDRFDSVNLEPWETLIVVKGYYGPLRGNNASVVRSLTFCSNRATYGPFGREEGIAFCFNVGSGISFQGFHGRCNSSYLCAIGVYVKTMADDRYKPNTAGHKTGCSTCEDYGCWTSEYLT